MFTEGCSRYKSGFPCRYHSMPDLASKCAFFFPFQFPRCFLFKVSFKYWAVWSNCDKSATYYWVVEIGCFFTISVQQIANPALLGWTILHDSLGFVTVQLDRTGKVLTDFLLLFRAIKRMETKWMNTTRSPALSREHPTECSADDWWPAEHNWGAAGREVVL